jgi:predicted permease
MAGILLDEYRNSRKGVRTVIEYKCYFRNMNDLVIRTSLPIFLLIGTGFFSRKVGILKAGDERVLSAYVFYFALPSLLFVNMAETELTRGMLMFVASGVIPLAMAVLIHVALYLIFGFNS